MGLKTQGASDVVQIRRHTSGCGTHDVQLGCIAGSERRGPRRRHTAAGVTGHAYRARCQTEFRHALCGADAVERDLSAQLGCAVGAFRPEVVRYRHGPSTHQREVEEFTFLHTGRRVGTEQGLRRCALQPERVDERLIRQ